MKSPRLARPYAVAQPVVCDYRLLSPATCCPCFMATTTMSGRVTSEDFWPTLPTPVVESHDGVGVTTGEQLGTAKRASATTGARLAKKPVCIRHRLWSKTAPSDSTVDAAASPPVDAVGDVIMPSQAVTDVDAPQRGLGCTRCRWGRRGCKTCAVLAFGTTRCYYVRVVRAMHLYCVACSQPLLDILIRLRPGAWVHQSPPEAKFLRPFF